MLLEYLIAFIFGILTGTFTGLIPGIHINTISAILLGISYFLLNYISINPLIIFIVAMSITHTFIDYIPSILLGAPDEDSFLSVLPGHKMFLEGKAHEAIVYTVYGSAFGIIIILILTPIFFLNLKIFYSSFQKMIPFILLIVFFILIFSEKKYKVRALIIFLISGILGYVSLNTNLDQPLLPLLTGLFGVSSVITSLSKKQKIPEQKINKIKNIRITKKEFSNSFFATLLSAPLFCFLPGLGAGQSAIIGSQLIGKPNNKEFLMLVGSINTVISGIAFLILYSLNKTRTGSAATVQRLIPTISPKLIFLILITIFITGIILIPITIILSKKISNKINKINYKSLSYLVLIILIIIVLIFSGVTGLIILVSSASLGIICFYLEIRRTHLMGCLMIPTLIFYLL